VRSRATLALAALVTVGLLAGCGKSSTSAAQKSGPIVQVAPVAPQGAVSLVTRNTTRVGGATPVEDAAAVARTVYPALTSATRPQALVIADDRDWPAALAAASLSAAPLGAPEIYSEGGELPEITEQTAAELRARGLPSLGGAGVITIGDAPAPQGLKAHNVAFVSPAAGAVQVAKLFTKLVGRPPAVIVVPLAAPANQTMAYAGLAAESATPILYAESAGIAPQTIAEIQSLGHVPIYVAASSYLSSSARQDLARLGTVKNISVGGPAESPSEASIAVARYSDGTFGWGIHNPGHGLLFARSSRPLDGPAAALLSATGEYAPLLALESATTITAPLKTYLADLQPGYEPGYGSEYPPAQSQYNRGWVIGDGSAIATTTQAELDTLLETAPSRRAGEEASTGATEAESTKTTP
jgi:hypothetical protein